MLHLRIFPVGLLLLVFLSGCAGMQVAKKVERSMAAGDYAGALAAIEKDKKQYAGANSLLYYFDRGALLQRTGDYSASSADLEEGELLIGQLYGTSVTEAVASMLVNDMSMSYTGEDFEQVMVHIIKELNYLYAHDLPGAMVEARKVNTRLLQLSDKYGKEAIYKQDAFARYLAAFAREAERDYNGAYIDYKKAYKAFEWYGKHYGMPMPPVIKEDLLRLSRWIGFNDEYRRWRKAFGDDIPEPSNRPQKRSELLLVVYDGMVPVKHTRYVAAPIKDPDGKPYVLKVAFPIFKPRPPALSRVRLGLPDGQVAVSQLMEPLAAIAIQNLDQRIGLITLKAIARATAKYIAAYQVRKATRSKNTGANLLIGLATNIFTYATEQADTRSWRTLPNRFHILRVCLPAGKHDLELRLVSLKGGVRSGGRSLMFDLKPGEKKVMPLYVPR